MSTCIGIDLGTTNTVVAAVKDGKALTLADESGLRLLPSVVSFHPSGQVLIGEPARQRRVIDAKNTIFSVKRLIGRAWSSPEVQGARGKFPFELREGPKDTTMVVARGEAYALPEISAFTLRRAKAIAEAALGEPVDRAVITVPANFNDLQRASTKVAGKLAGLEVLRILNEPTAAALAYGQSIAHAERIAIFDLGGGTFDITLLDLSGSVFEVLATAGDTALGGDDIDMLVAERMADQFVQIHRFDPRTDAEAFGRLRIFAEQLKIELSFQTEASVELKEIGYGEGGVALNMRFRMTRQELEHLARPLIDKTTDVTKFAIETVGLKKEQFDRVILVGGATRMPLVAQRVEEYFGKPPFIKVNPDEVVALGAAIQAYSLDRNARGQAKPSPKKASPGGATAAGIGPGPGAGAAADPLAHAVVGGGAPAQSQGNVAAARKAPDSQRGLGGAPSSSRQVAAAATRPGPAPSAGRIEAGKTAMMGGAAQPRRQEDPGALPPELGGAIVGGDKARPATSPGRPPGPPPGARQAPPGPPPAPPGPPPARPAAAATGFDLAGEPVVPAPVMSVGGAPGPGSSPPMAPFDQFVAPVPSGDRPVDIELPHAGRRLSFSEPPPAASAGGQSSRAGAPAVGGAAPPAGATGALPAPLPHIPLGGPLPGTPAAALAAANEGIETRHAPLLIDVTPLSLSVETVGGYCDVLIGANSPVPCDRTRVFLTASDGQTAVSVRVAQGESRKFAENTFLGECELTGLKAAPRGEVKIAVTFEIDADGILNVKAKDQATGTLAQARLKLLGANTDAGDVDRMMERQARHAVS